DQDGAGDVGLAVVGDPVVEVVDLAVAGDLGACGPGAVLVAQLDRAALVVLEGALGAAHVQRHGLGTYDHSSHGRPAQQATQVRRRQQRAVLRTDRGELANLVAVTSTGVGGGGQVGLGGEEGLLGHGDHDLGGYVFGGGQVTFGQDRAGDGLQGVGVALAQGAGVVLGGAGGGGFDRELEA